MPAMTPQQWDEKWGECHDNKDVDGVLALYAPEAVIVPEPGARIDVAGLRGVVDTFLAMNGSLKFDQKGVIEGPCLATLYTGWTFDGAGPDGPVNMEGVATVVLSKKGDGSWVAVLDDFFSQA